MSALQRLLFLRADLTAEFTSNGPGKESSAHADFSVDAPAFNDHPCFYKCLLPGKNMGINCINERTVQVENKRFQSSSKTIVTTIFAETVRLKGFKPAICV